MIFGVIPGTLVIGIVVTAPVNMPKAQAEKFEVGLLRLLRLPPQLE